MKPSQILRELMQRRNMSASQVARAIKAMSPRTPVVLSTGWGQRMADQDGRVGDVDFALSKPPKLAELRAVLTQIATAARRA